MLRKPRPRLRDFSYVGKYQYFLTFCTCNRSPVFQDPTLIHDVMSQFSHFEARHGFARTAHVVMPDHIHLVTRGLSDSSDLHAFVKAAKQHTGFTYKSATRQHLWQPSFYDHIVRDDVELWLIVRYMVLNPVSAGLVADPAEYPHWDVAGWNRKEVLDDVRRHPGEVWIPSRDREEARQA